MLMESSGGWQFALGEVDWTFRLEDLEDALTLRQVNHFNC